MSEVDGHCIHVPNPGYSQSYDLSVRDSNVHTKSSVSHFSHLHRGTFV